MTDMILAFTGHRPDKLGGYDISNNSKYWEIVDKTREYLLKLKPTAVISGMALGFDQWAANVALGLNIKLIAAIPFRGQELRWPIKSQDNYKQLLARASKIEIICPGNYAAWKMQKRNEWMINNSDAVLACWDGSEGGTANCYRYAERIGKPIHRIIP